MEHNPDYTIALLERTPAALNALLRELPDAWIFGNEGEHTFNVVEVIGHLIHAERADWIPRVHTILEHGESQAFEPFDRQGFADEEPSGGIASLLDEFARARSQSLSTLRGLNLRPEDLARRGLHPAFGPVTLSQLLATWAAHDLTHLHQISRVMAHQYRKAVGPWSAYLGVLQCGGHSAA